MKTKTIRIWEQQMKKFLSSMELNLKERTEDIKYHKRKVEWHKTILKEIEIDISLSKQQITETKNRLKAGK